MSISQPFRCAFAPPTTLSSRSVLRLQRRYFHHSRCCKARPPPKFLNIKASDLGLTKPTITAADFPHYTESEKAYLQKKYTPDQLAAIEAGEATISQDDLASQSVLREDPMALNYIDDFATIRPVIDKPIRAPEENYDPNLRFKDEDEIAEDLANWVENLPDNPDRVEWMKFMDNMRLTVGKEEAELNPRSYLAPEIPKLTDERIVAVAKKAATNKAESERGPHVTKLAQKTGLSPSQITRFRTKNLVEHRVMNQTRLGKVQSQYFLTVAGNGKGLLGIGEGKGVEPEDAKKQAEMNAIRNMRPITRYEERTIYGVVKGKVGATELELMTRPPGMSC